MEAKYYFPISSVSLAHYFGNACIYPSKYLPNKPIDIQNKFDDYLLITSRLGTKETDCCLELVFTKEETKQFIKINNDFFIYANPLPITRVKSILFSNQKQKEHTLVNITMSTAFIPEKLIKIIEKFDDIKTNNLEMPQHISREDWTTQIKKFNSLLGGFALMRLGGEEYMNYSEYYFSTLSFFNEVIKRELLKAGKTIDARFVDSFIGESSFKRLYQIINKIVVEKDVHEIASEENQIIVKDRFSDIIELNNLEKATYIVAVLNTFGVAGESKKKIDGLILSNFKSEIKPDKSEVLALCYGLNKGYSVFNNKYKSGNIEKIVKFELNSKLDYYTIESLFQYSFYGTKSDAFTYLDTWCPKFPERNINKKKNEYQVLDICVVGKKKATVLSQDYLANLLQRFFQKETEAYFNIFFEKIRTVIYNDTKEELQDELLIKYVEIDKLTTEKEKVYKLETELERMYNVNSNLQQSEKDNVVIYRENEGKASVIEETKKPGYLIETKKVLDAFLKYNKITFPMLKNEANSKGIIISKSATKNDIIVLLMTTPKTIVDLKLPYSE